MERGGSQRVESQSLTDKQGKRAPDYNCAADRDRHGSKSLGVLARETAPAEKVPLNLNGDTNRLASLIYLVGTS